MSAPTPISGDDPPCPRGTFICFRMEAKQKAKFLATSFVGMGAITGALIGTIKIKIVIY